eukprot:6411435-Heterocapsa_arctica.AAC.1
MFPRGHRERSSSSSDRCERSNSSSSPSTSPEAVPGSIPAPPGLEPPRLQPPKVERPEANAAG